VVPLCIVCVCVAGLYYQLEPFLLLVKVSICKLACAWRFVWVRRVIRVHACVYVRACVRARTIDSCTPIRIIVDICHNNLASVSVKIRFGLSREEDGAFYQVALYSVNMFPVMI